MTSTVDLLAAIGTHLAEFELPEIASVHLNTDPAGSPVTVQLLSHEPTALAQGLLCWADTLTEITAHTWRVPQGNSIHLSLTGRLPSGTPIRVYGGTHYTHRGPGTDLAPGATTVVSMATLRHLATPGQLTGEASL